MNYSKTVPLGELASVRTVMTFRDKAPQYDPYGNACVITIKELLSSKVFDTSTLPTANADESDLRNQLVPGEVLLPGRGDHYQARHFVGAPVPVFPVGQINVLRPIGDVDSNYLAWYLNQDEAQHYIAHSLAGTGIKALSKTRLLAMPIPLAPFDVQKKIATLQDLQMTRSALLSELDELNQREINAACFAILRKNNR